MHFNSTTKWGKIKVDYESNHINNKKIKKNIEEKSDTAAKLSENCEMGSRLPITELYVSVERGKFEHDSAPNR